MVVTVVKSLTDRGCFPPLILVDNPGNNGQVLIRSSVLYRDTSRDVRNDVNTEASEDGCLVPLLQSHCHLLGHHLHILRRVQCHC